MPESPASCSPESTATSALVRRSELDLGLDDHLAEQALRDVALPVGELHETPHLALGGARGHDDPRSEHDPGEVRFGHLAWKITAGPRVSGTGPVSLTRSLADSPSAP